MWVSKSREFPQDAPLRTIAWSVGEFVELQLTGNKGHVENTLPLSDRIVDELVHERLRESGNLALSIEQGNRKAWFRVNVAGAPSAPLALTP